MTFCAVLIESCIVRKVHRNVEGIGSGRIGMSCGNSGRFGSHGFWQKIGKSIVKLSRHECEPRLMWLINQRHFLHNTRTSSRVPICILDGSLPRVDLVQLTCRIETRSTLPKFMALRGVGITVREPQYLSIIKIFRRTTKRSQSWWFIVVWIKIVGLFVQCIALLFAKSGKSSALLKARVSC